MERNRTNDDRRIWASRFGVIAFFLLIVSAPATPQGLHVHDAGRAASSKNAKEAFAQFSTGDQDVFGVMIENVRALQKKTIVELYGLNQTKVRTAVNAVSERKWPNLADKAKKLEPEFLEAYASSKTLSTGSQAQILDATATLKDASDILTARQAEFNMKKAELTVRAPKLDDLRKSADEVRAAVSFHPRKINSIADLAQFKVYQSAWNGLSGAKDWLDQIQKASHTPGLQLTLLDLGVELQKAKVDRIRLDLARAQEEVAFATRVQDLLNLVVGAGSFVKLTRNLAPCTPTETDNCRYPFATSPDEMVLMTMSRLAKEANLEMGTEPKSTLALRNMADTLARYIATLGYQKYLLMEAMLDHITEQQIEAIEEAAINGRIRAVLISHGLEGLATFYAGGITSDDIANIIRSAQTIATAVIAGKVP